MRSPKERSSPELMKALKDISAVASNTARKIEPTEKVALPGGFIYDVYNEDDGFRHRLRLSGTVGEWQGYTMPATLTLNGATYFVVTDFFGGSLGLVQPGKLYKITEAVSIPGVVTNA